MLLTNETNIKRAIAYYRHSAEDKQENSVPIQREHAQKFAAKHNIEIIHEEADEGVSGLIANRPGFKRLFNEWVLNVNAPRFDYVFFYDVSRWGRFQDQDEGAYYAFLCKQQGKQLVNVSHGFPQEGQGLATSLIASIDRFMAAEYSRVLSEKVWHGCIKVSRDGFLTGGSPPYGMGRLLLNVNKQPIRVLQKGEHKQIANERVILTPLNDQATQTVKDIFDLFVNKWMEPEDIADAINEKGIPSAKGGKWDREKVIRILNNETYTGAIIYNKTWGRLKQKKVDNPRSEWVITHNAFEGIVDKEVFNKARERLYWLIPTRWKKGVYRINKISQTIDAEILNMFMKKGLDEDHATYAAKSFPVVYCVTSTKESVSHWYFSIPEKSRNFRSAIGVSVNLDGKDPIDKIFLIPTDDFFMTNSLTFSEKNEEFKKFVIEHADLEEKIISVANQLQMQKQN